MRLLLPFFLLILPLAEIAVFVMVGSEIGVFPTVGLVIATTVAGSILLRVQGLGTVTRLRSAVERGEAPGRELAHGAMIVLAALLLILPGFITDTLGFLLFIPWVRERAWQFLRSRVTVTTTTMRRGGSGHRTIDLDEDDFSRRPADEDDDLRQIGR